MHGGRPRRRPPCRHPFLEASSRGLVRGPQSGRGPAQAGARPEGAGFL